MSARLLVVPLAALASALALVAAGCGDDGGDTTTTEASPAVAWAGTLCTAITTWTDDLTAIADQLQDPSSLSSDSLEQAANDAVDATKTFVDDVQALGPPDTEAGQQAQDDLDALATTLEDGSAEIESALEGASGLAGVLAAIPTISSTMGTMLTAVSDTYMQIRGLDADDELKDAFEQAESCSSVPGTS